MQIGQQGGHLLLGESAGEGGHHSLPRLHILPHRLVGGGSAAGQRLPRKDAMQVRRNLLEGQVVVLVAMGAVFLVEALPFRFLWSERWRRAAGGKARSEEHTSELQSLRHLVCRL